MGFGEWIKQKRSENDWTQMQLSQITGIPQTTISNWERYKTNPSLKRYKRQGTGKEKELIG